MEDWEKQYRIRLGELIVKEMLRELLPVFLAGFAIGAVVVGAVAIIMIMIMI